MEAIVTCLVPLLLLPLETLNFALSGPEKFIKHRMEKHSPEIFQTSLLGEKMAIFCGAKGNKFLFTNENKLVTSWWPKSMNKVLLFPEFVAKNPTADSAFRRILHQIETLKNLVPTMDALACEHMAREWKPNTVVKILLLSKKYTFELACRLFLSEIDPVRIQKLFDPFNVVTEGMLSVPIDLPGTAYRRAMRGGEVVRIIREQMERRGEGEERDLPSRMMLIRDEEGAFLCEKQICNYIMGLPVAGYDTTSSAITSVMNYLAQHPHVYHEQMAIAESKDPGELLRWEDIEKMKYSWNVARESLRLTPPAAGAFREATTEFSYQGFTIPKGWKAFWTVHSSHMNPDYFPEPDKFDPSRFEGSGPPPYTFVPFGGGPRMCTGKEYARFELLVFMHNVVTRFKLEKTIPNEKIILLASPVPVSGLPVYLHPLQN
ncbi:beta-amyrin 28-monooxygenase [Salvia divinorum]|uniref:Beta-amyrin 28-monooxygenase n=1 Tax=Salvia divinorum TaxID=28513 RepID=A0ABD1GIJ1_SALDI